VLALVWGVAVWLLLRTTVPGGLRLPPVDVDGVFGRRFVERAERYERVLYVIWLLSQAVLLATLALYARYGARFARESAAGRIGTGMLLGMLGFGLVWLSQLAFGLADLWWERRHGLIETGYLEWAISNWGVLGAEFLGVCFALLIVMGLAGRFGDRWWIPGSAVFVALGALFSFVFPWLPGGADTKPLRDPRLVAASERLQRAQGIEGVPVRVQEVSDETKLVNAYAAGYGPSRRIVLWDTLLEDFPPRQVEVVLAHEIGHHSSNHIVKGIAWYALFAVPGAYLIARLTRRRGGMREPEAVPLSLFVLVALQLLALPATSWITRRMESEADWKALESTHDPAAARGAFRGLAHASLADPAPPRLLHLVLDSHPTLAARVAMAEAWRARQR
jgi:Zn-dependent protease with chaperone function